MAKGLKTFNNLPGEDVIYETTDLSIFVPIAQVDNNTRTILDREKIYEKNPWAVTDVINVIPVDEKTLGIVDYYSSNKPKPGHKFAVYGSNADLFVKSIESFNAKNLVKGRIKTISFRCINLKKHKQTLHEVATVEARLISKKSSLVNATEANIKILNGHSSAQVTTYGWIRKDAIYYMKTVYGTATYNTAAIRTALSAQGDWSIQSRNDYKNGNYSGYDVNCGNDVRQEADFLAGIIQNFGGNFVPGGKKCESLARFVFEERSKGNSVDFARILTHLNNYPKKAVGTVCTACGNLIPGYVDRMNNLDKKDNPDTWRDIIRDITNEKGY